ncbi:tyrosine-type recombinase/integrase [Metaplanococcus flavidus]|uniref:Tyrosine-type recombinase/integrase n=1 Tax=Metaplanococcus flavidus TaxID=569883 RepID=A0ABW3L890_9BACL
MELVLYENQKKIYYVFLDKKLKVVQLPTKFLLSINNRSLRYSEASIKHYAKVLKYFVNYLEKHFKESVDVLLAVIDGITISEYLKLLKDKGLSESTIRNREAIIKELMTWLTTEEAGCVRKNNGYANHRYKSPTPSRKIPKYLTIEEIVEFINLLHDESQRCLIHFLFDSGIRISEVSRLKMSDLPKLKDFSEDTMYFDIDIHGSKGRGGMIKERKTFISKAMVMRINRLHKQHPLYRKSSRKYGADMPCFLNIKGVPLTENAIKNLLYKTAQRGGLETKKYSAHKFRHSFAVSVLMSEFDTDFINKLVIVRDALGHNDIKTTEIYAHIPPAAIKNLQAKNKDHNILYRFEESQYIYERTYLPMKNHREKRGRS